MSKSVWLLTMPCAVFVSCKRGSRNQPSPRRSAASMMPDDSSSTVIKSGLLGVESSKNFGLWAATWINWRDDHGANHRSVSGQPLEGDTVPAHFFYVGIGFAWRRGADCGRDSTNHPGRDGQRLRAVLVPI